MSGYGEGSTNARPRRRHLTTTVGEPMFLAEDMLNEAVGTEAIRGYVVYSEGIPASTAPHPDNPHSPYLLGPELRNGVDFSP